MKWDYGDAGDRWPVQTGETWRVDEHLFTCGELELVGELLLEVAAPVGLAYIDPPWNQGNLTSFRTKAGLEERRAFDAFRARLCTLLSTLDGPCFIEMGCATVDALIDDIERAGGDVLAEWGITYYRTKPCSLVLCTFNVTYRPPSLPNLEGMDDEKTPYAALEWAKAESDAAVVDLCAGRGLTSRAAHSNGMRFCGVELHPRRMACALDELGFLVGCDPELVAD